MQIFLKSSKTVFIFCSTAPSVTHLQLLSQSVLPQHWCLVTPQHTLHSPQLQERASPILSLSPSPKMYQQVVIISTLNGVVKIVWIKAISLFFILIHTVLLITWLGSTVKKIRKQGKNKDVRLFVSLGARVFLTRKMLQKCDFYLLLMRFQSLPRQLWDYHMQPFSSLSPMTFVEWAFVSHTLLYLLHWTNIYCVAQVQGM